VRVFIYEYTCASEDLTLDPSLRAQGWAMLSAVLADFSRIPKVEARTLLNRERYPASTGQPYCAIESENSDSQFRHLARSSDHTLVIAPESERILLTRCRWAEEEGGKLLGPSSGAVQLTGDKLICGRHLRERGIPTPECFELGFETWQNGLRWPAVCKPRHGAGCHATYLVHSPDELALVAVAQDVHLAEHLLQPFVSGRPASVALLVSANQCLPLLPAAQIISEDGRFEYRGGALPLDLHLRSRAVSLARRALEVIPGLQGYVGVDLVLENAADGSDDFVMEINSRLTTSYIGLRAMTETNLAELMLQAAAAARIIEPVWQEGLVHFEPDGGITRQVF
jgi:predicted ATP-grasp superfamily ATP-dependent carboligase